MNKKLIFAIRISLVLICIFIVFNIFSNKTIKDIFQKEKIYSSFSNIKMINTKNNEEIVINDQSKVQDFLSEFLNLRCKRTFRTIFKGADNIENVILTLSNDNEDYVLVNIYNDEYISLNVYNKIKVFKIMREKNILPKIIMDLSK